MKKRLRANGHCGCNWLPLREGLSRSGRPGLALGELEALAGAGTTRLLALDFTCIASHQAELAQLLAVGLIELDQCASDREAHGARLARHATAIEARLHVEATERVGQRERLLDGRHERRARKIVTERTAVHVPLAR